MGPQKVAKTKEREEEKKKNDKKENISNVCVCLAIVCWKCIQEKLSLRHNHCFLCCIDGKVQEKEKSTKKKNTLKKIYFCTKVILSLAYVFISFCGLLYALFVEILKG